MTTPIAYITSVPKDPFAAQGYLGAGGTQLRNESPHQYLISRVYWLPSPPTFHINAYAAGYSWVVYSAGPSNKAFSPWVLYAGFGDNDPSTPGADLGRVYDSTNGTTSFGFILRTNKGVTTGGG